MGKISAQACPEPATTEFSNVTAISRPTPQPNNDNRAVLSDHFVRQDSVEYAGTHLLLDLWQASRLDDIDHIETALRECVEASGATLLHIHLHHFTPSGVSGVAVLAESHISVHTWPERGYAAFDVFMCGGVRPEEAVPVLERAFTPGRMEVTRHLRGRVD